MSNPYSTGGGGTHFEARVVAYYLAAALAEAPARAVPGLRVTTVLAQRAAFGEPLDDAVVNGILNDGQSTKLSLQVKSSLAFTDKDAEWVSVLGQAWDTFASGNFNADRETLGVAISSYSARTDKYYQAVLSWAAHSPNGEDFARRIARDDFSHKDQRSFVATTRKLLADHAGTTIDDDTAWRFFRSFRIVHFDFDSGDASRDLVGALDRLRQFLPLEQRDQAAAIWAHLILTAGQITPTGGGASRTTLATALRNAGLPTGQGTTFWRDLQVLDLESKRAQASIKGDMHGIRLNRIGPYERVQEALEAARFVQIDGEPGSGKSALLKQLVEESSQSGPTFLLKDNRIQPRGWSAHAGQLGISGNLVGLMGEVAAVSDPILFIDGIDKINDPAVQLTVNDLVRAISSEQALSRWKVLVTVREQNLDHIATWLDPDALKGLPVRSVTMPPLDSNELAAVAAEFPRLRPLLLEASKADVILRRPFFLEAVLELSGNEGTTTLPATEVELLKLWWNHGGAAEREGFAPVQHRRTALLDLADRLLAAPGSPISIRNLSPEPLENLKSAGVIRDKQIGHSVTFSHDIYEEWALCEWLMGRLPEIAQALMIHREPQTLVRPLQLLGSHELENYATEAQWQRLYEHLSDATLRPVWQRAVLTSCLRSTRTTEILGRLSGYLHRDNDDGLKKLLNALQTLEVVPNPRFLDETLLPDLEPDVRARLAHAAAWPKPLTWVRFLDWYLPHAGDPSPSLIPALLPVFKTWQERYAGQNIRHCSRIGEIANDWLLEFEAALHVESFHDRRDPFGVDFEGDEECDLEGQIRALFLSSAADAGELVTTYLERKGRDRLSHMYRETILPATGGIARALPKQVVDYVLAVLLKHPKDAQSHRGYGLLEFDALGIDGDSSLYPASPNQPPFLTLLRQHKDEGLRLVKRICNHSIDVWRWSHQRGDHNRAARTPLPIDLDLPWGSQRFTGDMQVYLWFRGTWGNNASRSALMALEVWALESIDAGQEFAEVFRQVLEGNESVAALGVAVSLCLAHPGKAVALALPLVTCPHVWQWDIARSVHDQAGMQSNEIGNLQRHRYLLSAVRDLNRKPHRKASIRDMVPMFVFSKDTAIKERYTAGIRSFVDQLPFTYADQLGNSDVVSALRKEMGWFVEQGDPQFWHSELTEDGKHIKFWNDPPSAKSQEHVNQVESSAQLNRFLRLSLWAQKSLDADHVDGTVTLEEALAEAKAIDSESLFDATDDSFEERNQRAAVSGTAYVLARFSDAAHWTPAAAEWTYHALRRAAEFRGVSDVTYRSSLLSMHPLVFAAHGIAGLIERGYEKEDCQRITLGLAVAPLEAVSGAVAISARQYAAKEPKFFWILFDLLVRHCIADRDALPDYHAPHWSEAEEVRNMALVDSAVTAISAGTRPLLPAIPLPWRKRQGSGVRQAVEPSGNTRNPVRFLWNIARRNVLRLLSAVALPWLKREGSRVHHDVGPTGYARNPVCFLWNIAQQTVLKVELQPLLATPEWRSEFLTLVGEMVEMTIQEVVPPFTDSRRDYRGNTPFEWVFAFFQWLGRVAVHLTTEEVDRVVLGPIFATDNETALLAMQTLQRSFLAHALLTPSTITDDAFATWQKIADWVIENPAGRTRGKHVDREFSMCLFSLLFCVSGDFGPLVCVVEEDWEPLSRFRTIVERVVTKFGTHPFLYLGVVKFLSKGGLMLAPEPGLAWLREIALVRKQDQDFWSRNGDDTVDVLKLILKGKEALLTQSHRDTISFVTDILVDNGVRGAGFLQQDQLRE